MSDRLAALLGAAERLTVDLIAQEPVSVRPHADTPGYARHVADDERFDVLPLVELDGRIVRYVRRDVLSQHPSETEWEGSEFDEIHADDIVSAASPMLDLLDRFNPNRARLFVLGRGGIDGIVTVYDLNQPAAHQIGFALALVVESELSLAIEGWARESDDELDVMVDRRIQECIGRLSRDAHREIRSRAARWSRKVARGDQVRITRELVFADKVLLVDKLKLAPVLAAECPEPYGSSADNLLSHLRDVRSLRNAVAHDWQELANEWAMLDWMRSAYYLAQGLGGADHADRAAMGS